MLHNTCTVTTVSCTWLTTESVVAEVGPFYGHLPVWSKSQGQGLQGTHIYQVTIQRRDYRNRVSTPEIGDDWPQLQSDQSLWQPGWRYTAYAVVLTKYCLNHCARTCCSLRIVTRCRFMNRPIRCERGGRNVLFLSINLISCRRSRDIVLVMASSAREIDSAGRQWNTEKDLRNVRDFSVQRLSSGSTIYLYGSTNAIRCCVCRQISSDAVAVR